MSETKGHPREIRADIAAAQRLEWWNIGWTIAVVAAIGLAMGGSQAMRTAASRRRRVRSRARSKKNFSNAASSCAKPGATSAPKWSGRRRQRASIRTRSRLKVSPTAGGSTVSPSEPEPSERDAFPDSARSPLNPLNLPAERCGAASSVRPLEGPVSSSKWMTKWGSRQPARPSPCGRRHKSGVVAGPTVAWRLQPTLSPGKPPALAPALNQPDNH